MSLLFDAVAALTVQDPDRARGLNGIGWNGTDSNFGHVLYEKGEDRWSFKMRCIAYKMIQKYRNQLAGYGITVADIPDPHTEAPTSLPGAVRGPAPKATVKEESGQLVITLPLGCELFRESVASIKSDLVGRRFDPVKKLWTAPASVSNKSQVHRLAGILNWDVSGVSGLEYAEKALSQAIEASKAVDAEVTIPKLKATLRGYQKAGIAYCVDHPKTIIGDDMGLGKTLQALATIELKGAYPAIIVATASTKLNWRDEIHKFLPHRKVIVLNGGSVQRVGKADLYVINYDILSKWRDVLLNLGAKALVCDESHYLKNAQALRTKQVKGWTVEEKGRKVKHTGLAEGKDYVLLLSGTATINRPSELIAQLQILDMLKEFGGWQHFVTYYCGGFKGRFGWDMSGKDWDPSIKAQRAKELNTKLRTLCYVRREKSQVLTELPPLQNALISLPITNQKEYDRAEDDVIAYLAQYVSKEKATSAERAEHLVRIETLKQLACKGMLEAAIKWIVDFVETDKLLVFADHIDVQKALISAMQEAGIMTAQILGGYSAEQRKAQENLFNTDPQCRVMVASLKGAREGINLQYDCSNVAFVELGWTPGGMDQAAARVHRIGQTASQVTAWYLLADGTIYQDIAALIDQKRTHTKAVLTGEEATSEESILGDLTERLLTRARSREYQEA